MTELYVEAKNSQHEIELAVKISDTHETSVKIDKPGPDGILYDFELGLLEAFLAIIAAQGLNAKRAKLAHSIPDGTLKPIQELCDIIIGSSCLTQDIDFQKCKIVAGSVSGESKIDAARRGSEEVILSWSGGKDALASYYLLDATNHSISTVHFTANTDVVDLEASAAKQLAKSKDLPLTFVPIDWDNLISEICSWRKAFGIFPVHNSIPHGRDVLLTAISCILASRQSIGKVALGYERDLLEKSVLRNNRPTWRHDAQSMPALSALNQIAQRVWGIEVFSPLAQFSEFQVFSHLTLHHPEDWRIIQSCFWNAWCGQCSKCRRYALLSAFWGRSDLIKFSRNPLDLDSPDFHKFLEGLLCEKQQPFHLTQVMCVDLMLCRLDAHDAHAATLWAKGREALGHSTLSILEEVSKIRMPSPANGCGLDFSRYI